MSEPVVHTLTELYYSEDVSGPLRLYIYDERGFHGGGQWFSKSVRYPDEEITADRARVEATVAVIAGREVRVTNSADFLVFWAKGGKVLFPKEGADQFWKAVCGEGNHE